MNLDAVTGAELIIKAYDQRSNDQLMQRWLIGGYDKELSFEDFKEKLVAHRVTDNKTNDEILEDVKEILITFNEKVVKE